jgi:hypothetical protein
VLDYLAEINWMRPLQELGSNSHPGRTLIDRRFSMARYVALVDGKPAGRPKQTSRSTPACSQQSTRQPLHAD